MERTEVGIAVDGPLYQFHPLFKDVMVESIPKFLKRDTKVKKKVKISSLGLLHQNE